MANRGGTPRSGDARTLRRGFTLIELSISIVVVLLLASLGTVAAAKVIRSSRNAAERQLLISIRQAVDAFRQQFGFLPPLVNDVDGPLTANPPYYPMVRDDDFIARNGSTLPDEPRYSVHSLTYYLMGVLDLSDARPGGAKPVDGVEGPGFTAPQRDGTFSQRGAPINPLLDSAKARSRLRRLDDPRSGGNNPAMRGRVVLVDRWGNEIRYYRWAPRFYRNASNSRDPRNGELDQFFVPRAVGDPNKDPQLRGAEYAIVSLGADGQTDERKPLPRIGPDGTPINAAPHTDAAPIDTSLTEDDLVEVGR